MKYNYISLVIATIFLYPRILVFIQNSGYTPPYKNKKFIFNSFLDICPSLLFGTAYLSDVAASITLFTVSVIFVIKGVLGVTRARIKPKFTPRSVRLTVVVVTTFFATISLIAIFSDSTIIPFFTVPIFYSILFIVLPIVGFLENFNNKKGLEKARRILESVPLKIGITGSAGKTTVKNALAAMLSKKFSVLSSTGNYNTPIGISKSLESYNGEEIFIAEMGARKKGDVSELVDLVRPSVGILTTVNPQHAESFGTVDDVYREKSLLIKAATSFSVVNADNDYIRSNLSDLNPTVAVGIDVYAESVTTSLEGTRFILKDGSKSLEVETVLLGRAAVTDIMLAYAVASRLGVSDEDIVDAVKEMDYIPHRMQKSTTRGGVTIIDDGYNSNTEGTAFALEFFSKTEGRKIVCAQGIVEQGKETKKVNTELGKNFAKVFDVIVTTGPNSKYIEKGVRECGFRGEVYSARDMKEVQKIFSLVLRPGDIVYLNNDVPDFL